MQNCCQRLAQSPWLVLLAAAIAHSATLAQTPIAPTWQVAAGGKLEFEVAAIRQAGPSSSEIGNVDLDSSDYFVRYTGGLVTTSGSLTNYIIFAYKIEDASEYPRVQAQLPRWAQTAQFYLEARPPALPGVIPTKDQLRLMVQSLLADRFKLVLHTEIRPHPAYLLTLDRPGAPGSLLQQHPEDALCTRASDQTDRPATKSLSAPPPRCELIVWRTDSGLTHMRIMAHTMSQIAGELSNVGVTMGDMEQLPVLDRTGLTGRFDLNLEFVRRKSNTRPSNEGFEEGPVGPTFIEALKKQDGLKLVKQIGPVTTWVIDHVEPLSGN